MKTLAVLTSGMVTGVGLSAPASFAAIRCKINRFEETRFFDRDGEPIIASSVPLEQPWRGRAKLVQMVASAIRECLAANAAVPVERIPLLLCVAEKERPGRLEGLDDAFLAELGDELRVVFHQRSAIIAQGRVGGAVAVEMARTLIHGDGFSLCLVAGADSFLSAATLAAYEQKDRLLTSLNSNGFIPGEAGTAVLLGHPGRDPKPELLCLGIGFGKERATVESEEPLRAEGLVEAFQAVCADSGGSLDDADYRLTDANGEQYFFKEAALAVSRTVRKLKKEFDIWHPVDCIGEVGAAIVPCVLGVALDAARKRYAPGVGALCHFSNDTGERAALLLRASEREGVRDG